LERVQQHFKAAYTLLWVVILRVMTYGYVSFPQQLNPTYLELL